MTPWIAEGRPGVFVVDRRQLLTRGHVWGMWFYPQNYSGGLELERAIDSFIADGPDRRSTPRARDRRGHPRRAWLVLEANAIDYQLVRRAGSETIVQHARACHRYGLDAVRAYFALFHGWPTVDEMRTAFVTYLPDALQRVVRYLRRRHELGRRQPLKSPAGRAWLARQALAILGRRYAVHMGAAGDVWLFHPMKNPGVRRMRGPRRPGRQS